MKHLTHILLLTLVAGCFSTPIVRASGGDAQYAVVEDVATVKPLDSGVEIDVPGDRDAHVEVYAITGQLVKNVRVPSGRSVIDLAAGCYIVRVDGRSVRIVIR